jgi:phosphatidylserine decarboxylase
MDYSNDYNFFYFKFIHLISTKNNYFIEIYCNNNNYFELFSAEYTNITIKPIIVPKYIKYIHIRITNIYDNKLSTFNILNNFGNHKLILNSEIIYLTIKHLIGYDDEYVEIGNYINDDTNKYFYHCELKTLIPEIKNDNWEFVNDILSFDNLFFKKIRKYLTNMIVWFLRSNISSYYINTFIEMYNIDIKQFVNVKYNSFNDFFQRDLLIQPKIIQYAIIFFRSPVTCRMIGLDVGNNYDKTKLWIKGTYFTIPKLIDENVDNINTILICRLTPQDYHHIHMPYTGILENINIIGEDYYSVNSKFVNSSVNVLTENYRHIYKFRGSYNGNEFIFWLVSIGSFVVNSIIHNMKIGNTYYSGQKIGNFSLGGSTVIVLSTQKININKDIEFFSNDKIESYVRVGDIIGSFAELNNVIFPKHYAINKPNKSISIEYFVIVSIRIAFVVLFLFVIRKLIKNQSKQYHT